VPVQTVVGCGNPGRTDGLLTSAEFRNPQGEWGSEESVQTVVGSSDGALTRAPQFGNP
jgi:hypothetical protein